MRDPQSKRVGCFGPAFFALAFFVCGMVAPFTAYTTATLKAGVEAPPEVVVQGGSTPVEVLGQSEGAARTTVVRVKTADYWKSVWSFLWPSLVGQEAIALSLVVLFLVAAAIVAPKHRLAAAFIMLCVAAAAVWPLFCYFSASFASAMSNEAGINATTEADRTTIVLNPQYLRDVLERYTSLLMLRWIPIGLALLTLLLPKGKKTSA